MGLVPKISPSHPCLLSTKNPIVQRFQPHQVKKGGFWSGIAVPTNTEGSSL